MDRFLLQDRLEQAEQHVKLGAEHIKRQHSIIARLEVCRGDVATARWLLRLFEELQVLHIATRDRLESELRKMKSDL